MKLCARNRLPHELAALERNCLVLLAPDQQNRNLRRRDALIDACRYSTHAETRATTTGRGRTPCTASELGTSLGQSGKRAGSTKSLAWPSAIVGIASVCHRNSPTTGQIERTHRRRRLPRHRIREDQRPNAIRMAARVHAGHVAARRHAAEIDLARRYAASRAARRVAAHRACRSTRRRDDPKNLGRRRRSGRRDIPRARDRPPSNPRCTTALRSRARARRRGRCPAHRPDSASCRRSAARTSPALHGAPHRRARASRDSSRRRSHPPTTRRRAENSSDDHDPTIHIAPDSGA